MNGYKKITEISEFNHDVNTNILTERILSKKQSSEPLERRRMLSSSYLEEK